MTAPSFALDGWTSIYYPLLGWSLRWQGDLPAATATFRERLSQLNTLRAHWGDNGYIAASLAMIEAGLGDVDAARRDARLGVELAGNDAFSRISLRSTEAAVLALAGLRDEALDALIRLADDPAVLNIADLRLSPVWDGYRDDPRFKQALAKAEAKIARQNQAAVVP